MLLRQCLDDARRDLIGGDDTIDRRVPPWLEGGNDNFSVTVRDLPLREHIDVPVRESLIVELYSK